MNKINIVTLLVLIVSSILISCLISVDGTFDTFMFILSIIISITFTMLYKKNNINKFKFIYNVILMLLMLLSGAFIIFFGYSIISCFISVSCYNNTSSNLEIVLLIILFTLTLLHLVDIKIEKNKMNHILTWIVSTIIVIIYIRYNYDMDFIHNYMYLNQYEIQNSYVYITQNYIYFVILYSSLLIHYLINKKISIKKLS